MGKIFRKPPLPFIGNKNKWHNEIKEVLIENRGKFTTVVDLFGGSGLISHWAKAYCPDCRVIYNDYDNYSGRLEKINNTNYILQEMNVLLKDVPKNGKLLNSERDIVMDFLFKQPTDSDWETITRTLLYSPNYVSNINDLVGKTLYCKRIAGVYDASGYLDDIEIVRMDWKDLYNLYKDETNILFIADPPYMTTDCKLYYNSNFIRLRDYLDVVDISNADRYIYFSSEKSGIIELYDYLNAKHELEYFKNTVRKHKNISCVNLNYDDIMIYKI